MAKKIKSLKIKLIDKFGSGSVFDWDWKLTIIDRTKRPFKKKTISRTQMVGTDIKNPISDIDDYIEWYHCVDDRTKYYNETE